MSKETILTSKQSNYCSPKIYAYLYILEISLYSPEFYAACAAGGALSCGLTHTLVTPLDLVKCRRQVSSRAVLSFNLSFLIKG
jgi:hypothetical protein